MMDDETVQTERPGVGRIRFSLLNLLLLVAVVGLAISLFLTHRKLDRLEHVLGATQPMVPEEVARQFEQHTNLGPVKAKVGDVRYSKKNDAYKVRFTWTDPWSNQDLSGEVLLQNDGFGKYRGAFVSDQFLKAIGSKLLEFPVEVETPSPFKSK
jgi:hypothetical protein